MGSVGKTPYSLKLRSRWRRVVSFMPRLLYSSGNHLIGAISQKMVTFIITAARTSNPAYTVRNLFSVNSGAYVALSRVRSLCPLIVVSGTNEIAICVYIGI
jgi:hypothetical protein